MAIRKMHLLAALCCFVILTTFVCDTQSASCCVSYSRRPVHCRRLIGYTIQHINVCDLPAIIFHLPGRFVCANPREEWTQRAMKCVDEPRGKRKSTKYTDASTPQIHA
ncbi:C-C motif chemokine 20b [Betta splendens]|uniref:C-C motif chemokine 20b n=1 Tax=Betta splendens TaxID=158456 RepID=A0A6P7MD34_BETSP|nr:C-C motif chemokine 20b [Betta splendens]